jgi:hypothetical protein
VGSGLFLEQMTWNKVACRFHATSSGSGLFPEEMSWNKAACGFHAASVGSGLFPEQTTWNEAACGFHAASLGSGSLAPSTLVLSPSSPQLSFIVPTSLNEERGGIGYVGWCLTSGDVVVVVVEMGVIVIVTWHHGGLTWGVVVAMTWQWLWVVMLSWWVDELPGIGNPQGAQWRQWWPRTGGGGGT